MRVLSLAVVFSALSLQSAVAQTGLPTKPQPKPPTFPAGSTPLPSTFPGGAPQPSSGGLTDQAKSFINKTNTGLGKSTETRDTRANGFNNVINGINNSAVPTDKDMVFSPNHKQIVDRRTPAVDPKEEKVMTALSSPISGDFTGMNFRQALDFISEKSGLTIVPDANSLKELNVEYDDPVNFKIAPKIATRTALRKVLADRGLAYVIVEGTVNIVSKEKAREYTTTRVYNIRDLVTPAFPTPQFVYNPIVGYIPVQQGVFPAGTPGVTPTFAQQMGATIADMVRTSVDPQYWAPNGPGTITFNEATGSLIVRASAEIHYMINGALYRR